MSCPKCMSGSGLCADCENGLYGEDQVKAESDDTPEGEDQGHITPDDARFLREMNRKSDHTPQAESEAAREARIERIRRAVAMYQSGKWDAPVLGFLLSCIDRLNASMTDIAKENSRLKRCCRDHTDELDRLKAEMGRK